MRRPSAASPAGFPYFESGFRAIAYVERAQDRGRVDFRCRLFDAIKTAAIVEARRTAGDCFCRIALQAAASCRDDRFAALRLEREALTLRARGISARVDEIAQFPKMERPPKKVALIPYEAVRCGALRRGMPGRAQVRESTQVRERLVLQRHARPPPQRREDLGDPILRRARVPLADAAVIGVGSCMRRRKTVSPRALRAAVTAREWSGLEIGTGCH